MSIIAENQKQYRLDNQDKIKQYYTDNREKLIKFQRIYRADNKDTISKQNKIYKQDNKVEITAQQTSSFICECGKSIQVRNKARHSRSIEHNELIKFKIPIQITALPIQLIQEPIIQDIPLPIPEATPSPIKKRTPQQEACARYYQKNKDILNAKTKIKYDKGLRYDRSRCAELDYMNLED